MKNQYSSLQQGKAGPRLTILALCAALACASPAVFAQSGADAVTSQRAAPFWQSSGVATPAAQAAPARAAVAKTPALQLTRMHAATLDLAGMQSFAAGAPLEKAGASLRALQSDSLTVSLPHPDGGFRRFSLVEAPIMEDGLAALHPEIKTYRGVGIDDPKATLRMDITPLGLHASVRSPNGGFFVDPLYKNDTSVYASYGRGDLVNQHGPFTENALGDTQVTLSRSFYAPADAIDVKANGFKAGASVTLEVRTEGSTETLTTLSAVADKTGAVSVTLPAGSLGNGGYEVVARSGATTSSTVFVVLDAAGSQDAVSGPTLRTYRLALVTDPTYASYFGAANVTAAKVTLVNRITQIYEDETSIRLVLIAGNDALNLNTAAQMTGANGPCGGSACYTVSQASSCTGGTLTRNRVVAGLLAGAGNFDVGHIALGNTGGGVASLGVVGGSSKAQGCTGVTTPVGDFFAVDYTAHELGHQFSGNHTFNGTLGSCSGGNRNAGTSVEPGSGSSIMAYAGICGSDNLQAHSDPYWSQRSFDEITAYTSSAENSLNEIQQSALIGYTTNGAQFQLRYNGQLSAPIVRGTNNTTAGIKAAIEAIPGWPSGATVTVGTVSDTGFTVTFGGTLAGINVPNLQLVSPSAGVTGYINDITSGGPTRRGGAVTQTGNSTPVVIAPATYTIPVRTPFTLTGSATDANDENLTYMWEQNDRGATNGTSLVSNVKTNGPLFRQFGTQALVTETATLEYNSPGENVVTGNPSRTFPDMVQILANNTNAETGVCPTASGTPTVAQIACFSEFLPTAAYVGVGGVNASPASLNFRLTVRDGNGGVGNAATQLVLAQAAGPFLVTSPNTAVTLDTGAQTVTWSVANTNVAPVNASNVKISLSLDGGVTFPTVLAESVPNTGSAAVTIPAVASTTARIKVEAVGNVFFDVSNANFTLVVPAAPEPVLGDVNGDGVVGCADINIVKAALGKRAGQTGYDARADVVANNLIDARDLTYVKSRLPAGTSCN
ncbi:MAG TPA: M12 family metallo-peptidase [Telluria sp.]